MKTQYELTEADIKEACAAFVSVKIGGHVYSKDVKLHVSTDKDDRSGFVSHRVTVMVNA